MTAETPTCKLCGLPMERKRPNVVGPGGFIMREYRWKCPLGPDDSLAHREIAKREEVIAGLVEALTAMRYCLYDPYGTLRQRLEAALAAAAPFVKEK